MIGAVIQAIQFKSFFGYKMANILYAMSSTVQEKIISLWLSEKNTSSGVLAMFQDRDWINTESLGESFDDNDCAIGLRTAFLKTKAVDQELNRIGKW